MGAKHGCQPPRRSQRLSNRGRQGGADEVRLAVVTHYAGILTGGKWRWL
jgi:hypothetical protein